MRLLVARARRRSVLLTMVVLALVVALAMPAAVLATPLSGLQVALVLQAQGSAEPVLMITGNLPEGTPLPAEIALPVPEGIEIDEIGAYQILGGPLEDDPQAMPRLEVRDGVSVAVFELTVSRTGKVEFLYPAATTALEEGLFRGSFELTATAPVDSVILAAFAPLGFEVVGSPEGSSLEPYPNGQLYSVETTAVAAGEGLAYGVDYRISTTPVSAPVAPAPEQGGVPIFLIVLVAAVLAGAVLLVLASRPKGDVQAEGEDASQEADGADSAAPARSSAQTKAQPKPKPKAPAAQAAGGSGLAAYLTPRNILIVVGVIAIGTVVVLNLGGESGDVGITKQEGTVVSQRISTAEAAQTSVFTIGIRCQCPPESEAIKMFDLLRGAQGVAHAALETVSIDPQRRIHTLQVSYDPGRVDATRISELLATTYDVYDVR